MKLTAFLLLAAVLQVSAATHAQTVTYTGRAVPLKTVLSAIEKQTSYVFFYDPADIKAVPPVTVELRHAALRQALDTLLGPHQLRYDMQGNTIMLVRKENVPPADIHGRVTDSLGNPLAGASVEVKGMKKGATTDVNGNFELKEVADNAVLIISYTGFETQEIRLRQRTGISVQLNPRSVALQDMVVNKGYYTESRKLSTGSVARIDSRTIEKQPVSNPLQALQGRMAGVNIQQSSGIAGGSFSIEIRGRNSLRNVPGNNGNLPLYIVDGMPINATAFTSSAVADGIFASSNNPGASPLSYLNVSDIESIEVLKDADATAIYGARGGNGVVLITTKKGRSGEARVDLNFYTGAGKITHKMDLLKTSEYMAMRKDFFAVSPFPIDASTAPDAFVWEQGRYTDWQKELIGNTAKITSLQASVNGGNANTRYLLGVGYYREGTVFPGDFHLERRSVHFTIDNSSFNNRLKLSLNGSFVSSVNNLMMQDLTRVAVSLPPNAPKLRNDDGSLNWENSTWDNPLAFLEKTYRSDVNNLLLNGQISIEIIKDLVFKTRLGLNNLYGKERMIQPSAYTNPAYPPFRQSFFGDNKRASWIAEPQLEYSRNIGAGKINLLAGLTWQHDNNDRLGVYGNGYTSDALLGSLRAATSWFYDENGITEYRYNAGYARLNYNLSDRYIVNITARRDGSSRFGPDKRFGNFGAIGAAWIFSSENWLKNSAILSFGKIRASYGTSGSDVVNDYQYLQNYFPTNYNYNDLPGLVPAILANPDYSWESVKKIEGGVELGFIGNKFLLNINVYRNRSSNQLVGYSLPAITGRTSITYNLPATVQNAGFEFDGQAHVISQKSFKWSLHFNLSIPSNKLVAFPNIEGSSYADVYTVGKSVYAIKRLHFLAVDPQTGVYQYEDVDKDGATSTPNDLTAYKIVGQKFFGGIGSNISFKNFQLDFLFQFVKQNGLDWVTAFAPIGLMNNQQRDALQYWKKPGDKALITGMDHIFDHFTMQTTDRGITDASYIRLKNVSLSYTIRASVMKKAKLSQFRLFVQGQNLLTLTKYKGMDPEVYAVTSLPTLRVITAGAQVSF